MQTGKIDPFQAQPDAPDVSHHWSEGFIFLYLIIRSGDILSGTGSELIVHQPVRTKWLKQT